MTPHNQCPECGAETTLMTKDATSAIPFGEAKWQQSVLHCSACGHEEPLETDDSVLSDALEKARVDSVLRMLARLKEHGVTMAELERAFALAPRTTHRWKEGKLSASALALLRAVATYPWLVALASFEFDPEVADSALLQATEKLFAHHGLSIEVKQQATLACPDNVVQVNFGSLVPPAHDPSNSVKVG